MLRLTLQRRALALTALFLFAATSAAHSAVPAKPSQMELAIDVSREIMSAIDIKGVIEANLTTSDTAQMFSLQPEWKPMLIDAFREQLDRDEDLILTLLGRDLASKFSSEELSAGRIILGDPSVRTTIRGAANGEPSKSMARPSKEAERVLRSSAGMSFMNKLAASDQFLDVFQKQMIIAVTPGIFRIFGERAEALETKRRVAEGLPASKQ